MLVPRCNTILSYGPRSGIASPSDSIDSSDVGLRPGVAWPPSIASTGMIREEPANQGARSGTVTFWLGDVATVLPQAD